MTEKNVSQRGETSRAKMIRSSSVTFWSLSVQIGGGRGHRRQVVVFDTLLLLVSLTKKIGTDRKRSSRADGRLLYVFVRPSLTVMPFWLLFQNLCVEESILKRFPWYIIATYPL